MCIREKKGRARVHFGFILHLRLYLILKERSLERDGTPEDIKLPPHQSTNMSNRYQKSARSRFHKTVSISVFDPEGFL